MNKGKADKLNPPNVARGVTAAPANPATQGARGPMGPKQVARKYFRHCNTLLYLWCFMLLFDNFVDTDPLPVLSAMFLISWLAGIYFDFEKCALTIILQLHYKYYNIIILSLSLPPADAS